MRISEKRVLAPVEVHLVQESVLLEHRRVRVQGTFAGLGHYNFGKF